MTNVTKNAADNALVAAELHGKSEAHTPQKHLLNCVGIWRSAKKQHTYEKNYQQQKQMQLYTTKTQM